MSELLERLLEGQSLDETLATQAFDAIFSGAWSPAQIASFLTALRLRGETVDELVGAATVMRRRMLPAPARADLLDTCGTGGDRSGTFNISTAAALVAAAAGVPVSKHGNRAVSSASGSADVLSHLGVPVELPPPAVIECLEAVGITFFFAPTWHPAMKAVMPVRKELGFRTIFNFLGPLCNPAGAGLQLVGTGSGAWAERIATALLRLGTRSATVVCGADGLDEVSLAGPTLAWCVRGRDIFREEWTPASFGLPTHDPAAWRVGGPADSARVIRAVLEGQGGPCRDIVLANAAAALWTSGKVADLPAGVALAGETVDSGAGARKLEQWIDRVRPRSGP